MPESEDFQIKTLGPCRIASPLRNLLLSEAQRHMFVRDSECAWITADMRPGRSAAADALALQRAGPRELIYFDPIKTRCGIVSCGGLCPGINDVIRGLVRHLWQIYGVRRIHGFRYGYQGLIAKYEHPLVDFSLEQVDGIEAQAGTVLGSSRGPQAVSEMVDCLERMGLNILFVIGGDGTLRGAQEMAAEVAQRNLKIAIIGIPKTIDNDLMYVDESFGFRTACSVAVQVLKAAHVESKGAPNGVGLVKLMGRHSGFIACYAALAMSDVNFVLIPEVPFKLEGESGFLNALRLRLQRHQHAVVAVAEGAGQEYLQQSQQKDASGNVVLQDIGVYLKERIKTYFKGLGMEVNLRYIDPSYALRSVPPSPQDSIYCMRLAQNAVHAGMCGKTELIISRLNGQFVHVPMRQTTALRKQVDPNGELYLTVLESTWQPRQFG